MDNTPDNDDIDAEFFPEFYDEEDVFDNQIQPMLKTILNICSEYKIPMVTSFQFKNADDEVMICSSVVLPPKRTCSKLYKAATILTK